MKFLSAAVRLYMKMKKAACGISPASRPLDSVGAYSVFSSVSVFGSLSEVFVYFKACPAR
jgi:hypothetical protein